MKLIYNCPSKSPGIYKITNTHTNRFYIGQAKSFQQRWHGHSSSLRSNKHQNKFLQADFNKCLAELGNDDFLEFTVLEVMENSTKEERNQREEQEIALHFDKGKQCYNLKEKVEGAERSCFSKNPAVTSKKLSDHAKKLWQDPVTREKFLTTHVGRKRSDETRALISKSQKGKVISAETIEKMRFTKQNKSEEEKAAISRKLFLASQTPEGIERSRKAGELVKSRALPPEERERRKLERQAKVKEKRREVAASKPKREPKSTPHDLIDPSGLRVTIKNIRAFCKERGFDHTSFYSLIAGKQKQAYGYTLPVNDL